ncbi:MAG: OmpA family protein [Bacteroidetes bacterium]|nr:OmpA family protein [Bacteroidota bacterium]
MKCSLILFILVSVFGSNQFKGIADDAVSAQCKVRLPESINRITPVIMPILTQDGTRLYFDRKNYAGNLGGLQDPDDIWESIRQPNGGWSEPENVRELNSAGSDVMFSLSRNEDFALVYNSILAKSGCGFGISYKTSDGWSPPKALSVRNYYNNSEFFFGNLSADNRILLFALERDDTRGGLDLYVSFRNETDSSWSPPMSLGATINTSQDEYSPFLAPDGKSLYFSSRGHGGLGGFDIFLSRRLDETWQYWSKPVNLGTSINTVGNDHSFTLNAAGDTVVMISTDAEHPREGIFFVCLPTALRPDKPTVISRNEIPHKSDTLLVFPIYFSLGKSSITAQSADSLLTALRTLDTDVDITLNGYACDIGTDSSNLSLASHRIAAVEKLLVTNKLSFKIYSKSYGENLLHNTPLTNDERNTQRRVDVIIMHNAKKPLR